MSRYFKNAGLEITIQTCLIYHFLGFNCIWNDGKDLIIAEEEVS